MKQSNVQWVRLGDYIQVVDERNEDKNTYEVVGINKDKDFMPTVANMDSVDTSKYKIVRKGYFVFSGMQTGRDECIRIALYEHDTPSLISPAYTTFIVNKTDVLIPEYFFMYFYRAEMDRLGWFISDSSVRSNLDWPRFLDIQIPLPSIERQQQVVDTWLGLRKMKEENEAIAAPLLQLCQSYIQDLKHKYPMVELGGYIEECNERNTENKYGVESLQGVTSDGVFDESKAKTDGLKFDNYKIVKKNFFAYNPSRINLGSIALNKDANCIISPMYIVFSVTKDDLLPEYLQQWFSRKEFQRSTLFFASGSVRDTFSFTEMCRVKIPLPPIEIQQAIVDIFRCANEAKKIAEEADRLSRNICPALLQHVIHEN